MTNLWTASHAATINPERFRAHNQYLEQLPAYPYRELLSYVHVQWPRLLDVLHEDEAFGCVTSEVDGKVVSRDLLDSACEIGFLLECDRSRGHATRNASASVSWVYDARVLDTLIFAIATHDGPQARVFLKKTAAGPRPGKVREKAIFWLGNAGDAQALADLKEIWKKSMKEVFHA